MSGTENKNRLALVCLLLALVTAAVYWPVHGHDFVYYDDNNYVTANPVVQSGLSGPAILWAFTTYRGTSTCWHPLTWLSHELDCQLFGLDAGWHHLMSVALHATNAVLLFLLLRRMTGAFWRSAIVAALFAWHPLQVDSVAWIAERKTVLSTLFLILTVMAYLRHVRAPSAARYLLVFLLLCLGLMAKPSLVIVPFLLLVLDFWPLRRMQNGESRFSFHASRLRRLLLEKLPLMLPVLFVCVITVISQVSVNVLPSLKDLPLSMRVANAFVACLRYTGKAVWPAHLAVFYPYPLSWPIWLVALGVGFFLVVSGLAVKWAASRPWFLAGWLWFLVGLFPTIGLVQTSNHSMADRYAYFPLIGLFIMAVWGVAEWLAGWRYRSFGLPAIASIALMAAVTATGFQVQCWRDTRTLFEHAIKVTTDNGLAQAALGSFYEHQDKFEAAIQHYSAALAAGTNFLGATSFQAFTHDAEGDVLVKQGKVDQAIPHYLRGLELEPTASLIRCNLADALNRLGRPEEAISQYKTVLRQEPGNTRAYHDLAWIWATSVDPRHRDAAQAVEYSKRLVALTGEKSLESWLMLATAYATANRTNDAVRTVQKAVELETAATHQNPRDMLPVALANLALTLVHQDQTDMGVALLSEAARLAHKATDRAELQRQIGVIFSDQRNYAQAAAYYTAALESNPRFAMAHNDLGLDLMSQGDRAGALEHYEQALKLDPQYAEAHRNLATVLIADGKLSEARSRLYEAIRLKPDYVDAINDLAWMLATAPDEKVRDAHEALRLARQAAHLTDERDAGILETLAAAYAEGGDFAQAAITTEQAIKLCEAASQKQLLETLQGCLGLFRAGKPVRQ